MEPVMNMCCCIINPRFFTYGDLPLEQHLEQIEDEALSKFERIDPNTAVPCQPLWSSPVSRSLTQHCIIINWTFTLVLLYHLQSTVKSVCFLTMCVCFYFCTAAGNVFFDDLIKVLI